MSTASEETYSRSRPHDLIAMEKWSLLPLTAFTGCLERYGLVILNKLIE